MKRIRGWVGAMALLLLQGTACAQEAAALDPARPALSQYRVDAWRAEQGLPMDTVQAVLQARDGALWVGTGAGLARFDGLRFSTFENSSLPGIARRSIFGLFEDAQGRMWIGHGSGVSLYVQGRFENPIPQPPPGPRRTWAFVQDREGAVWMATEGGLLRWQAGQVRRWGQAEGLPHERLRALALDREGALWIGFAGPGLAVMRKDGRIESFGTAEGFPAAEVRHLLPHPAGGVWVATAGGGLLHVGSDGRMQRWGVQDGLPSEHLTHLASDAAGALWMGHWGHGLSRMVGGRITHIDRKSGLAGDQTWAVHADREGSLWVGSWNGGLNRLRPRVFAVLGEPEGLAGDNARTVLHARDGSTWVASAGGGVSRIANGRIQRIGEREGLASLEASALHEDTDGAMWIGSYTAGLTRWQDGRAQRFTEAEGQTQFDVRAVLRDRAGRLWVGTKGGLMTLGPDGRRFRRVPDLPAESVTVLLESSDGSLWAGSAGQGLWQLRDGVLVRRLGREQGLGSNWIMALHEDERGVLWIGTNGEGISRLAPDGRAVHVTPDQGLWDGVILSLLPDHQGQFWVSTNRGFFRVARAALDALAEGRSSRVDSVGYGPGDALRSTTFAGGVQPAGAVDEAGHIWLPSLRGVVIIDPKRLPDGGRAPQAQVTEAAVAGQWQTLQAPGGEALRLPAGAAPLTLRWSANTVLNAERVRFRFQMRGLSDEWIDVGTARETRFPALPPGEFQFRVAASLNGQQWRESEPLAVTVPPLLTQSLGFQLAVAAAAVGLGYAAYRLRTRALRRREDALRLLVDERTEALRRANAELEKLSFTDALTGLANRRRFDELLHTEWRRCARQHQALALLVIDIDYFKAYNDSLGHGAGDEALRAVAALIQQHGGRAGELAVRYGGEEFVLLLPGVGLAAARAQAERLRQACEAAGLPHPGSPLGPVLTLSIGSASCMPSDDGRPDSLFAAADAALYRAKAQGRNRVA